jgi:alpha-beta hydrolase superfamily lysophospholipase
MLVSGMGGTRYTHSFLAEYLAAAGMCVVAPETPARCRTADRWVHLQLRYESIRAVLSAIADADLPVELSDTGAAYIGHSSGASIGLLLAGARLTASTSWAQTTPLDISLQSLVLLDPALGGAFDGSTLAAIRTPTAVFYSGSGMPSCGPPGSFVERLAACRWRTSRRRWALRVLQRPPPVPS